MRKAEYRKMFLLESTHFWFVGKRLIIKSLLDRYCHCNNLQILDVGCGTGAVTQLLTAYGSVIGIDNHPSAISFCKQRGLSVTIGDALNLPYQNQSFDLVTLIDVLYHKKITDEKQAVNEAWRVLKPGGRLLIIDSAFAFLSSQHDQAMHGRRRFRLIDIQKLLADKQPLIIKKTYFYFFLFPLIIIKRKLFNHLIRTKSSDVAPVSPLINQILIILLQFEVWLTRFINLPYGSSLVFFVQKPAHYHHY